MYSAPNMVNFAWHLHVPRYTLAFTCIAMSAIYLKAEVVFCNTGGGGRGGGGDHLYLDVRYNVKLTNLYL